uniref:BED-type domain-containing protein n=1 Tax=Chenopodium quinoa TaxID=63459 RepID=A0A803N0Y0_CHEQI
MDTHVQQLSFGEEEEIDYTIKDKGKGKNQKTSSDKPHVILTDKKRQRRLSSSVWVHFEFLDEPDENGNLICKCKKCGSRFNADSKNGTGNLHCHLKSFKQRSFRDVSQMILEKTSSSLGNRLPDFDAIYFRELLSLAIVEHDMPFLFVEFKEFSTFMVVAVVLDPRYKLQCVNWGYMRIYGHHSVKYELEFYKVKDALRGLYEAYESSHSSSSDASDAANEALDDIMMDFESFSMEQSSVAIKFEIDMYYEEPLIHRGTNLDILSYWRTCSTANWQKKARLITNVAQRHHRRKKPAVLDMQSKLSGDFMKADVVPYSAHIPSYADTWGWVMASDSELILKAEDFNLRVKQRINGENRFLDGTTFLSASTLSKAV